MKGGNISVTGALLSAYLARGQFRRRKEAGGEKSSCLSQRGTYIFLEGNANEGDSNTLRVSAATKIKSNIWHDRSCAFLSVLSTALY